MNLYIRADADGKIGAGHVMRCIALAQGWQYQGGTVTFISHCESNAIKDRILQEGFQFIAIDNPHPHPDDLSRTLKFLKQPSDVNLHPSEAWLVLDGYHFTPAYQKAIREAGIHLLVIDDMNHLSCYHADILLNQNIYAPELKYHCDDDTTLLLGTRYVLLRKEFLKYGNFNHQIPERARNILVTLGGADPDNVTLKVIEALKLLGDQDIEVKIVIGPANSHRETLSRSLSATNLEAEFLPDPPNMPELMAWADMAISAGGSTCWELAFMGLPSLIVLLAENQGALVDHTVRQQAAVSLGWHDRLADEQLCHKVKLLIHGQALRKTISVNASPLIDGQGAFRVTKVMTGRLITMRQVTQDDCDLIWQWSNENETRKASYSNESISWDEHVRWFKEKLGDANHVFFIALNERGKPVGQIRYAINDNKATVSVSIAPKSRSLGYGSELLTVAAKKLFDETEVDEILAYIKEGNTVSLKAFQKAGFILTEERYFQGIKSQKYILRKK